MSRIKRLKKTINGERVDSFSVWLEFQGSVLPERVRTGCMRFPVRSYIPPPLLLYKYIYGIVWTYSCGWEGKQRCPKCGSDHRVEEDCRDKVKDKCCNCGGQHRVTYGSCEARKSAVENEKVKAEAVKKVQGQREREESHRVNQSTRAGPGRTEGALTIDKLLLFITYMIKCTDQIK